MMMETQPPVAVPDFNGKTLQQVRAEAVVPGSKKPLFRTISPTGPEDGVVASQNPKANTRVIPGTVQLALTLETPPSSSAQTILQQVMSQQKNGVQVPKLEGDTREVAAQALEVRRLQPDFTGDVKDAGVTVIQQSLPAGKWVDPGKTVSVTLALPRKIVPLLYGMTLTDATRTLRQDALQVDTVEGENTDGSTVTAQYPPAGTYLDQGKSVEIELTSHSVASGQLTTTPPPPQVYVPNLLEMSLDQALDALTSLGLRRGEVSGPSNGRVSDQKPTAGTMESAGRSVNLTFVQAGTPVNTAVMTGPWWQTMSRQTWQIIAAAVCGGVLVVVLAGKILARLRPPPSAAAH